MNPEVTEELIVMPPAGPYLNWEDTAPAVLDLVAVVEIG